ncbi:MAG TPA: hypothetical protein DDW52_00350 [Planctomycetaceae bacterium]|nr:hypothetical protein [Planctomycetaceae bacterium]
MIATVLLHGREVLTLPRIFGLTLLVAIVLADPRLRMANYFVDFRAAIFLISVIASYLFIRCDSTDWLDAMRVVLHQECSTDVRMLTAALNWFNAAIRGGLVAGVVGCLVNLVGTFMDSHAPIHNHVNGTAVSLLYLLYAVVLTQLVLLPIADAIKFRLEDTHAIERAASMGADHDAEPCHEPKPSC